MRSISPRHIFDQDLCFNCDKTPPSIMKKHIWPELVKHYPAKEEQPEVAEVEKRLLYIQAVEAVKAYDENIVTTPESADIGSIMGIGFPPFTGGIFSFMDGMGLDRFVKECDARAEKYGKRFQPPKLLRTMAKEGKAFY